MEVAVVCGREQQGVLPGAREVLEVTLHRRQEMRRDRDVTDPGVGLRQADDHLPVGPDNGPADLGCHGIGRCPRDESTREVSEVMSMPRTVQDILDHAEELAKRFEDYEPSTADERDSEVFGELRRAVLSRSDAERSVRDAVKHARERGCTWAFIGSLVGTSVKRPASATATSRTRRPRSACSLIVTPGRPGQVIGSAPRIATRVLQDSSSRSLCPVVVGCGRLWSGICGEYARKLFGGQAFSLVTALSPMVCKSIA